MSKTELLEFGLRLRRAREARGLTQTELGANAGIDPSRISNWERGDNYPQYRSLVAMCKVLDCSSDYLLGLSDRAPAPDISNAKALLLEVADILSKYDSE